MNQPTHLPPPTRRRPVFLDLTKIRMPVGALTSILHRASGVLMAAAVPFFIYLLGRSLQGEQGFAEALGVLNHRAVKVLLVVLIWALAHHVLAGIRHMLTDISIGSTLHAARRNAWLVNLGALLVALLAAGRLA